MDSSATAAKRRKLDGEESPEPGAPVEGDTEVAPPEADPEVASDGESDGGSDYEEESPLEELFAAIWGAADEGRKVSTLFQLLPSRAMYPDYYQYIKEPIDLKMIGTKIQSNAYQTTSDLEKDLNLMIRNAKYYNEPGSQVYKDANLLRRILSSKKSELDMRKRDSSGAATTTKSRRRRRTSGYQKLSAAAAALQYDQEDGDPNIPAGNVSLASGDDTMMDDVNEDDDESPEDSTDPLWMIFDSVRSYKDANGHSNVNPFMRLPNKRYYPDYYIEIKNPISLSKIQSKIRAGNYKDASFLVEDLNVMFENAKKYNRPDSKIYEDACNMQKVMQKRAKELINYAPPSPAAVEEEDEEEEDVAEDAAISIPPIEVKLETSQMSIKDDTENEESNDAPVAVPVGLSTPVNISAVSVGDGYSPFSVTIKKKIAKRLVTGYIIFASEVRKSVVAAHPDCNFGDISRIIGAEWKNLSEDVKKDYEKKAQKQNEITAQEAAKEAMDRPQSPSQLRQVIQNAVYECHWQHKCDFQCEDTTDLFDHLTAEPTGHVWKSYEAVKDKEEPIFQCLFHGCGRVKKGAAPFPNIQRLIRHIKEVHVTKQQPKSIPPCKRGRNFLPSKNNPQPLIIQDIMPDLHDDGSNSHPPASPRPPPELVFECHWEGKCDFTFEDSQDLLDHLTIEPNGHVWRSYEKDKDKEANIFQCLFQGCGRVKKGATPFPTVIRLIKHVKDIHVTKQIAKAVPVEKRRNFVASKANPHPIAMPVTAVPQQIIQPIQMTTSISYPVPNSANLSYPQNTYWTTKSPTKSTATQVEPEEPIIAKPIPPRLVHSSTYIKYIERLRPDFKHVTNWEAQLNASVDNSAPVRSQLPSVSEWLQNGAGNHGSVVNALWALRNLMFQDCLTLATKDN